ncbi:MAG: PorP/SprF family type IX secretion system membrane protein [Crocinitomicaceae bacterium]
MRIPGNFDRWMFNYKEGNLSAEEAAYFEAFMLANPNFSQDVEAWDNAFVRKEEMEYPQMNSLLKEKGAFASWKNWAAILILLLTIGGGIGLANRSLNKSNQTYHSRSLTNSDIKADRYLSPQTTRPLIAANQITQNSFISEAAAKALNNSNFEQKTNRNGIEKSNFNNSFSNSSSSESNSDSELAAETDNQFYRNFYSAGGSPAKKSDSQKKNRKIDSDKIKGNSNDYSGSYNLNPSFDASPLDTEFKKNTTSLLMFRIKRILNKIDNISGYPIALVNLRDPELLVPNKNVLNFNPGFTGSGGNFRMGADYRNQWTGSDVNSQLSSLYFDSYSKGARGGIGGSLVYGQYQNGEYQNMTANLYYSPKFALGKHVVFEPAIKVTMGRNARNIEGAQSASAIEFDRGRVFNQGEITQSVRNDSWYKDYGVGFVLNTDWFYVGGFVDNLAGHDERIYGSEFDLAVQSPHIITGVIGFDYQSRNKRTTLSPFLTYYQKGTKKEAWAGATAQFNWLTLGASYSSNNEYAASVGLKFKAFKLTYQVDMTESEFLQENFVSHNIGIRFSTPNMTIR